MLPMGIAVALVGGLLMAEPDMGAFVVMFPVITGWLLVSYNVEEELGSVESVV